MNFVKNLFKREPLPIKDPNDNTLTKSSTPWVNQDYWCYQCKSSRSHEEYMAGTCSSCGVFHNIGLRGCNIRKIWNGEKWVQQYRERTGRSWVSE